MHTRVRSVKTSKSKSMALASARWTLFDQPHLLDGEDAAVYQELLARIRAAVRPVDIIDHIFISDIATLEWEVLRWRRLKVSMLRGLGLAALEAFLRAKLDDHLCVDRFVSLLREFPEGKNLPEDQAQTLARECARNEPAAVDKVNKILKPTSLDVDDILDGAKRLTARDLMQQYVRREAAAVTLVDELLAQAGTSMDALLVNKLPEKLDNIERIERLTADAEQRRNAGLHEIDRRRSLLGEALRRTLSEVEGEFEVIEATPAKGEKAV